MADSLLDIIRENAPGYNLNEEIKHDFVTKVRLIFGTLNLYKGGVEGLYEDIIKLYEINLSKIFILGIENQYVHLAGERTAEFEAVRHISIAEKAKLKSFFESIEKYASPDLFGDQPYRFFEHAVDCIIMEVYSQGFRYCADQYFKHINEKVFGIPDAKK